MKWSGGEPTPFPISFRFKMWGSCSTWQGMISLTTGRVTRNQQDYYSTFHRTPNRKKFSKEWENITQESTRHAVAELASSDSDNTIGSGSDSTEENLVESGNRFSLY
ncbi:hypothetical protein CsSME_00046216 [Camellia sinensis var. sinensis]